MNRDDAMLKIVQDVFEDGKSLVRAWNAAQKHDPRMTQIEWIFTTRNAPRNRPPNNTLHRTEDRGRWAG